MSRPIALLLWLALIVLAVLIGVNVRQTRDWPAFKAAHHCQVIGFEDAYTGQKFLTGSGAAPSVAGKVGYQCDNGEVWR